MSRRTLSLDDTLYDYLLRVSLREPQILAELREETARMPLARMQIAPEQGQFMALLVRLLGARKCLEIGVFTGYSTLVTALAMPDDGHLVACDINKKWAAVAQRYWARAAVDHKIDLRLAPALETLDELRRDGHEDTFDFAFIDADKAGYIDYYEQCLSLLRPGGLLCVDNVLWGGRVSDESNDDADTRAIREFNHHVSTDNRIDLSLIPVGDGLGLMRRRP